MASLVKRFLKEDDGMGTAELVVIISGLVIIALLFRKTITSWVTETLNKIFKGGGMDDVTNDNYK